MVNSTVTGRNSEASDKDSARDPSPASDASEPKKASTVQKTEEKSNEKKSKKVLKRRKGRPLKKPGKSEKKEEQSICKGEVEKIIGHGKKKKIGDVYLVHWKGLKKSDDSWVPKGQLKCDNLIKAYHKNLTKTPQKDEYVVEEILDHRRLHGKIYYLIKWQGYSHSDNTWEEKHNLNCNEMVKKHHEDYNQALYEREISKKKSYDEANDKNEFEVEKIVGHKKGAKGMKYLVRWKNFGPEDDSWETESSLNCPDLVNAYNKNGQKKIKLKKKSKKSDSDDDEDYSDSKSKLKEFEIDRLLDARVNKNGKFEFLVSWKGYTPEYNNWEPEVNLLNDELIRLFFNKHKVLPSIKRKIDEENQKATPTSSPMKIARKTANSTKENKEKSSSSGTQNTPRKTSRKTK